MKIKKHIIATSILLCAFVTINNSCSQAETYEYDKLNRITKIIYDDGSITRYVYDKNGNLKSVISETNEPEVTSTPEPTATPEITPEPEVTAKPETTEEPKATPTPAVTEQPDDYDNNSAIENVIETIVEGVSKIIDAIINFFKNLF